MQPLLDAHRRSPRSFKLHRIRRSPCLLAGAALALVQACVHVPGPHDMPVGVYHFRFVDDTAGYTREEMEALANRSGTVVLGPSERATCDAPEEECWDLDGGYALTPEGYAIVRLALKRAGVADSLPARGKATGAWRGKPGGPFWVVLNDSGAGPRVAFRATPSRKHRTAEGAWCVGACGDSAAGKLLIVRTKM